MFDCNRREVPYWSSERSQIQVKGHRYRSTNTRHLEHLECKLHDVRDYLN